MPRTITAKERHRSEEVAPGLFLEAFHPGGKDGPNGEVLSHYPGGQSWSETIILGEASDPFQAAIPDIRMPANQLWPLHWHDCWVGIVLLEGECMIGDWWMKPGDVLITEAAVEYGPMLVGPAGCRMFEIFARLHLQSGGYGPEFRDHPTLQGASMPFNFTERTGVNTRNEGRQSLPIGDLAGFTKGRLSPGSRWDLGRADDPERGVMAVHGLAAGERLPPKTFGDWTALLVMGGSLQVAGHSVAKDEFLRIAPGNHLEDVTGGADGAVLLEVARSAGRR